MQPLDAIQIALLDRWQRGFPLVAHPYAVLARDIGIGEDALLGELRRLLDVGVVSRIGAALRPNTAGASRLAAMSVPPEKLEAIAEIVNAEAGVNHNYEREHAFNLWFVVTGADRQALDTALARIRARSGLDILELPLVRSFYIDLGFPLADGPSAATTRRAVDDARTPPPVLDATDRALLRAIEPGLPLVSEPYRRVGELIGITQAQVIQRLAGLIGQSVVTRFGLIVRHRSLGFNANAMAVWDVADGDVDAIGARLAADPSVTLCYRRPRHLPHWPYNLFCMVHGRERDTVVEHVARLTALGGLGLRQHAILFSRRCFRQRGPTLAAA